MLFPALAFQTVEFDVVYNLLRLFILPVEAFGANNDLELLQKLFITVRIFANPTSLQLLYTVVFKVLFASRPTAYFIKFLKVFRFGFVALFAINALDWMSH